MVEVDVESVAVVDMSISGEGLVNKLHSHCMAIERPEYEGQTRTTTKDIIFYQREIFKEQVCLENLAICQSID